MRFMLLQYYAEPDSGAPILWEWTPEDVQAHIAFQHALNDELIRNGEFVDAQGLTGPELAKSVTWDGKGAPVVTDGPYPETKELIAGYRMIEVDSLERAIEIAAKAAAAPGPDGVPLQDHIEVREVMGAPTTDRVNDDTTAEGLLRTLAPQALAVVARRTGSFADAEDAVQEALITATDGWSDHGIPDNPLGWLVRVASRRMIDRHRSDTARQRREDLAHTTDLGGETPTGTDDTLIMVFLCCHPGLAPPSAIPLTLRAVAGLTTREIAAAFLVPEATMAQRISRAKATLRETEEPFALPGEAERPERLRSVLHVLYLLFNEGYATSSGPDLARVDLSDEAIRLARAAHGAMPDDAEVAGLLALMLLTDARRPARTGFHGELVPLAEQDRTRWDRTKIREGVALVTDALRRGEIGEYQAQAAIAAVHDQALDDADTDWPQILALYRVLERMHDNPMVTLNRAVATAMVDGPDAGLAVVDVAAAQLGDHHRVAAVRGHLLELAGRRDDAVVELRRAAARTTSTRERDYLTLKAAILARS